MSYNPIMTIALGILVLKSIGKAVALISHDCDALAGDLEELGNKIVENLEDENLRQIFMDTDFKDRTVFNIVCYNFMPLLVEDDKISALLDELWVGKLSYECDGRTDCYSMLKFLSSAPIRKLPG